METTLTSIFVCKDDNSFKQYNIKEILESFINFRRRTLKRITAFEINSAKKRKHILEGLVYSYIHGNGRIGVLVEVNCETDFVAQTDNFKALCKDIAMQIAAAKPAYLKREEVPADVLEHEKEVLRQQALNEGKPEKIVEKMIVGRIEKFYKENCLLDQEFIKDSDKTVQQVVTEAVAKIGEKIDIRRYTRYELGEGLEKRNDDFVSEVMAQAK